MTISPCYRCNISYMPSWLFYLDTDTIYPTSHHDRIFYPDTDTIYPTSHHEHLSWHRCNISYKPSWLYYSDTDTIYPTSQHEHLSWHRCNISYKPSWLFYPDTDTIYPTSHHDHLIINHQGLLTWPNISHIYLIQPYVPPWWPYLFYQFTAYFNMLSNLILCPYILHLSINSCPWTLRMIYDFNFFCSILKYVYVLHWRVSFHYCGSLVNREISLTLVIQIFYPSAFSVLYSKDVYPTVSIVWSTTFPFIVLKITLCYIKQYHIFSTIHAFVLYWYYGLYIFMYISLCLYIIITIIFWVLSIFPFIQYISLIIMVLLTWHICNIFLQTSGLF